MFQVSCFLFRVSGFGFRVLGFRFLGLGLGVPQGESGDAYGNGGRYDLGVGTNAGDVEHYPYNARAMGCVW